MYVIHSRVSPFHKVQIRSGATVKRTTVLKVTHSEFIPQLQTFVVLIMLIFFTIELSMIYFSLLLTTIVKFKIKAIHAEGLIEI